MITKYLLPCLCGQKLRVNATQAGETVQCTCGASLTVPSLRELPNLELAPSTTANRKSRKRPWSKRQGWILLGAFLVAAAVGLLGFLQLTRPRLAGIESLSPIQVWSLWQDLRRGPDRNLSPTEQRFLELLGIHRVWQTALLAAAATGVVMMAVAYAIPDPSSSRRAAPRGNGP
jgi:hypothetical protein